MTSSIRNHIFALFVGLSLVACGDDAPMDEDGGVAMDGGEELDATPGTDAEVDGGGEVDAGLVSCTDYPIEIAGTEAADALAADPARCGAADYEWIRGAAVAEMGIGTVTSFDEPGRVPGILLRALADMYAAGLTEQPIGDLDVEYRVVRYMTQDRGVPIEASTLVAYPEEGGGNYDMLLFLHGTSGFTDGCGVSGEDDWITLTALLASLGYIVVSPDYIGLKNGGEPTGFTHPYLGGEPTAIASIDALRAAARLMPELRADTCPTNRVVTLGGSQGGHATLWVERLMPYYGREFDNLGYVATVPPAAIYEQAQRALTEFVDASANMVGMLSALSGWYGVRDRISEVLVPPLDEAVPAALDAGCSFDGELEAPETLEEVFTTSVLEAAAGEGIQTLQPWGCMIEESDLFRTSIARVASDVPLLFVTGEADPLVHTPIERTSYQRLCSDLGVQAQYIECEGANHGEGTSWALPEILDWIVDRYEGVAIGETCAEPTVVRCRGTQD